MSTLPKRFTDFVETYPDVADGYQRIGRAVAKAGPLDAKTQALVKLGMAIGAGIEGGAHSQIRKALDAGATAEELRQTALLALTTLGFPTMMKGLSWVDEIIRKSQEEGAKA
jgi:alkylhydroperoxidase/carboxymuconolactone decarboxylase family protein YurZ